MCLCILFKPDSFVPVCSSPLESPLLNFGVGTEHNNPNILLGLEWPVSFPNTSSISDIDSQASNEHNFPIGNNLPDRINQTIFIAGKNFGIFYLLNSSNLFI